MFIDCKLDKNFTLHSKCSTFFSCFSRIYCQFRFQGLLSQWIWACKKFYFICTTQVIVAEMIFDSFFKKYFLMGVQNLWNHFTICNRHKNFFSLLFAKSKFKVFSGNFPTFFNHNSSDQSSTWFYFENSESKYPYGELEISAKVWNCF